MKKTLGFTSFEFYFVMSAVGIIALVAMQRYMYLAEETRRLSFEVVAKNFNASVYNYHARWIMAQQQTQIYQLNIDDIYFQFTAQGWPLTVAQEDKLSVVSIAGCLSLWNSLLQNPPSISHGGVDPYGSRVYHLSLSQEGACRYELITDHPGEFYFDYRPFSGQVIFHTPPSIKNN